MENNSRKREHWSTRVGKELDGLRYVIEKATLVIVYSFALYYLIRVLLLVANNH